MKDSEIIKRRSFVKSIVTLIPTSSSSNKLILLIASKKSRLTRLSATLQFSGIFFKS